jgi:hypothetical protein
MDFGSIVLVTMLRCLPAVGAEGELQSCARVMGDYDGDEPEDDDGGDDE